MPIESRTDTPAGIRPSPQGLSRGNVARSRSTVLRPADPSITARAAPAGPAPTIATWASRPFNEAAHSGKALLIYELHPDPIPRLMATRAADQVVVITGASSG